MDYYMLTTTDNPFSPVTQYDEWHTWDMAHGYWSNSLLARVVRSSPELSDADQELAIQEGIDEIVKENVSGMHMKIKAEPLTSSIEHQSSDEDQTDLRAA